MLGRRLILLIWVIFISVVFTNATEGTHLQNDLQNATSAKEKVDVFNKHSQSLVKDNRSLAAGLAKKAYLLAKENNYETGLIESYLNLARSLLQIDDFKKATILIHAALKRAKKLQDPKYISDCYYLFGKSHYITNDATKQLQYLTKALEIRKALPDKLALANSYNSIGVIHFNAKDYVLAKAYFEKALDLRVEGKDNKGAAGSYNNLALIAELQNDTANYFKNMVKAIQLNKQEQAMRSLATNYGNLSLMYLSMQEIDSAWKYTNKSLQIRKEKGFTDQLAGSYADIARILTAKEEYNDAIDYFEKSEEMAKEHNLLAWQLRYYTHIGELYRITGNMAKSREYLNFIKTKEDSIKKAMDLERINKVGEVEDIYSQKENKKTSTPLIFWVLLGLAVLVIAFLLVRKRR